jgi:hypothetical protein
MLCPCWYAVKELMVMDQGWCGTAILYRIGDGRADGIDLSGRTIVLAALFPGPTLFDGNATARLSIDEAASADQRRELEAIMQGKKGGPMEILAGLITTWLPTQTTKIEVREENGTVSAAVGSFGQINSRRLKNEAGQPMTMQNVGFAVALQFDNYTAELAPSAGTQWSDPDLPQQWESKSGAVGRFTWNISE